MTSTEVDTMDAGSLRAAYKGLMNDYQHLAATNKPELIERNRNLEKLSEEAMAEAYRLRRLWEFSASMISANSSKIRPRGKDEERLIKMAKKADHGMAWAGTTDGWLDEAIKDE